MDLRTTEPFRSDSRTFFLTYEPSDLRTFGLMNLLTYEPSDFGIFSCTPSFSPEINKVYLILYYLIL